MATKLSPLIMFCLLLSGQTSADEFALLNSESIGSLHLNAGEQDIVKALPDCHLSRGNEELWEADGLYHQSWSDDECGTSIDMTSEQKGTAKSLASITVTAPSKAKTGRGISIGSSESEVESAYRAEYNAEGSQKGVEFVAGSIYGGLIFSFEQHKVNRIFLGAAAE